MSFQGLRELQKELDKWKREQIDAGRKGGINIEQFRSREYDMVMDLARKTEKDYKWVCKRVTKETAKPRNELGVIPMEEDGKVSGDPSMVESLFAPIDVGTELKSELVELFEIDSLLHTLFEEDGKGVLFERRTVKAVYEHAWKEGYLKEGKRTGPQEPQPGNFFIGNPGIGKSWSLLMLLRLALEHGELVHYTSVKKEKDLLFIPNTNSGMRKFGSLDDCSTGTNPGYTVLWLSQQAISLVPRLRTCLWIIDPGEVTQGLELPKTLGMAPQRECRIYVAVPDNRKHFTNYVEKGKWIRHIVDMATEEEIEAMLASGCWKVDADAAVVRDRWAVVGGAMRYLEKEGLYNEFVSRIEAETLPLEDIKKLLTTDRPYVGAGLAVAPNCS